MTAQLSLSVIEIIVLMLGAVILGITIHFFISSRRSFNASVTEMQKGKSNSELTEWKLRYFNDTESRDQEIIELKKRLTDAEENVNIFSIEAEETGKLNKKLKKEIEELRQAHPAEEKPGYIEQLRQAQKNMLEHNEKINQLLNQVELVKETETKQQELTEANEELAAKIAELQQLLSRKEKEIGTIRQKEHLTGEMTSMIDSAYNEFNTLKDKIQKLESQVNVSKTISLEYEDIKEEHYKMSQDYEEQRMKYTAAVAGNQQLQTLLTEMEEKLKEANFQRQQLQKKVAYLEELNNDMQVITEANKKLEGQMKRIGELESLLNVVEEERDELAKRQLHT